MIFIVFRHLNEVETFATINATKILTIVASESHTNRVECIYILKISRERYVRAGTCFHMQLFFSSVRHVYLFIYSVFIYLFIYLPSIVT